MRRLRVQVPSPAPLRIKTGIGPRNASGELPEWLKGAGCKPAGDAYGGSNPSLPTMRFYGSYARLYYIEVTRFLIKCPFLGRSRAGLIRVEFGSRDMNDRAGIAQMARASAFQAEGRGFESRFPLQLTTSPRSSVVEHFLGKEEAAGSIPAVGSIIDEMQGPPGLRIN